MLEKPTAEDKESQTLEGEILEMVEHSPAEDRQLVRKIDLW